jgi:transcriptional regulator with XRE-family HTH domain
MASKGTSEIDRAIGRRIKTYRIALGMSQERLAGLLGLTFQQVQKYEKGVNRVSAARLLDLARLFGIAVSSFYEELPFADQPSDSSLLDIFTNRQGLELAHAFSQIGNSDVRRAIITLAKVAARAE